MIPEDCVVKFSLSSLPPTYTPRSNPQLDVPNTSFSSLTWQSILRPFVLSVCKAIPSFGFRHLLCYTASPVLAPKKKGSLQRDHELREK